MFDHIHDLAARTDEASTRALVELLARRGAAQTERVFDALIARGPGIVPLLSDTLDRLNGVSHDRNAHRQRKAVCRLLGELGDGRVVDQLLDTPSDARDVAADRALLALDEAAVDALIDALDGPFTDRTVRAIQALTAIGGLDRDDAIEALARHLRTIEPDYGHHRLLLEALASAARHPAAADALVGHAERFSPTPAVQGALAAAVATLPDRVVAHVVAIEGQLAAAEDLARLAQVLTGLPRSATTARETARELVRRWLCDAPLGGLATALAALGDARDIELLAETMGTRVVHDTPAFVAALRELDDADLPARIASLVPGCDLLFAPRLAEALRGKRALEDAALNAARRAGLVELLAVLALHLGRPEAAVTEVGRWLADRLPRDLERSQSGHASSVLTAIASLAPATCSDALRETVCACWTAELRTVARASRKRRKVARRPLGPLAVARLAVAAPDDDDEIFACLMDALELQRDVLYTQLGQNVHAGLLTPHHALVGALERLESLAACLVRHAAVIPTTLRAGFGERLLEIVGITERLDRLFPARHASAMLQRCRDALIDSCVALADVELERMLPRRLHEDLRHGDERDTSLELARRALERRNAPDWLVAALRVDGQEAPR